ncbi:MAG: GNAT family N-acetyltransferase [Bacteroidetes bacterium]|nr:MAG: GNAT family N-acetyltransferase [Bacteroidota bacterium]
MANKFRIETKRLILREITVHDASAMYELNLDPLIKQYTLDDPYTSIEAAAESWATYDHYKKHGYGRWAVVLKETNEILGWCGLKNNGNFIDIGYRLIPRFRGNGYTTEAAKACIEYGFKTLNMQEIIARTIKDNTASIKVIKKLGMHYWKEETCKNHPAIYYRISK